jgi:thiamine-phosphate pyrophosphorylase
MSSLYENKKQNPQTEVQSDRRRITEKDFILYAVTDRHWLNGDTLYSQVEKALQGGVTFVQLREKNMPQEELLREATEIKELCRSYNVPFVINDNVELTRRIDADGVHVGQEDMEVINARAILGPDKIIGVSAHNVEEAMLAEKNGADYLGVGAAFATSSKNDAHAINHDTITDICNAVNIPVVAIGGITKENVAELKGRGINGVAVISAIFGQENITEAAAELKKRVVEII